MPRASYASPPFPAPVIVPRNEDERNLLIFSRFAYVCVRVHTHVRSVAFVRRINLIYKQSLVVPYHYSIPLSRGRHWKRRVNNSNDFVEGGHDPCPPYFPESKKRPRRSSVGGKEKKKKRIKIYIYIYFLPKNTRRSVGVILIIFSSVWFHPRQRGRGKENAAGSQENYRQPR